LHEQFDLIASRAPAAVVPNPRATITLQAMMRIAGPVMVLSMAAAATVTQAPTLVKEIFSTSLRKSFFISITAFLGL